MVKNDVNMTKVALIVATLCIYIIPSNYIDGTPLPLPSYIFAVFLVSCLLLALVGRIVISPVEIILGIFMFVCGIYQKSLSLVVVLTPVICRIIFSQESKKEVIDFLLKSRWIDVALAFTALYSILYFHLDGRVAHAAVFEVNVSGYAILMLGLIYLRRKRLLGLFILLFGCLTLSRSYLFSILFILLIMNIPFIKDKLGTIRRVPLFGAIGLLIISCFILYFFGLYMQNLYIEGHIVYYDSFIDRIIHPYDSSNYFRFTVNVIEINVFNQHPLFWLFGCSRDEFLVLAHQYASVHGFWYRNNNPHNFVFSYLKLYGVSGIISVLLSARLVDVNVNKNNYYMMLSLIMYPIFLSVGFNGIWLFITIPVLMLYSFDIEYANEHVYACEIIKKDNISSSRI